MQHDAFFFIGVFVFIFLIWVAAGGPTHPLAFTGPILAEPGVLGGGTYLSLPQAPFVIGNSNVSLLGSSNGSSFSTNNSSNAPRTVGGVAFGPPSLYRGMVTLGGYVSGAGGDPQSEYVGIRVGSDANTPVDLSGWTIESEASGNAIVIPQGTEVPTSGIVNAIQDIVLAPGEDAMVTSGRSPIGASFRENKCIGYFSQFQNFSPPLPQICPAPPNELMSFYGADYLRDGACIDYVNKLSRCQATLSPPVFLSGACQSFLVKYFNYNGCVDAHRNDADFEQNTWRVYLGRTNAMWRTTHEEVKLLDKDGKTVDAFTY